MKILRILVAILAALAVAFALVGIFVPRFTYENAIEISAPVEQTFAVFNDVSRMGEWMLGFESIENISGEPGQVGSRWELVFVEGDRRMVMQEEVTAYQENERLAFKLDNAVLTSDIEVKFEKHDGRTVVRQIADIEGKNLFYRSLLYLSKDSMYERGQENFQRLKHLVEAEATSPAGA